MHQQIIMQGRARILAIGSTVARVGKSPDPFGFSSDLELFCAPGGKSSRSPQSTSSSETSIPIDFLFFFLFGHISISIPSIPSSITTTCSKTTQNLGVSNNFSLFSITTMTDISMHTISLLFVLPLHVPP